MVLLRCLGVLWARRSLRQSQGIARLVVAASLWSGLDGGADELPPTTRVAPSAPTTSRFVSGPLLYEAGKISVGERVTHEFSISNPDGDARAIAIVGRSCRCVVSKVVGGTTLQPGGTARVAVTVAPEASGRTMNGVYLKVSGEAEPLFLRIGATVTDDGRVTPESLDFGRVTRNDAPVVRPLHIAHTGLSKDALEIFQAIEISQTTQTTTDVQAVRVTGQSKVRTTPTEDKDVVTYECDLDVVLDPKAIGDVSARVSVLDVNARAGDRRLRFEVPCRVEVVPPVTAVPAALVRIDRALPEWIMLTTKLEPLRPGSPVVVGSVEGDGVVVEAWTQAADAKSGAALVNLSLQFPPSTNRLTGSCRFILKDPAGEVVTVPVRFVRTGSQTRDEQTGKP
jgi:hypothetical protein